jgi:hypothetical protein
MTEHSDEQALFRSGSSPCKNPIDAMIPLLNRGGQSSEVVLDHGTDPGVAYALSFNHDQDFRILRSDPRNQDGDDLRSFPLSLRKTNLARLLARRPDGIFLARFEQGEIGPDLFRAASNMGLEGLVSKRRDRPYHAGRYWGVRVTSF